jgi:cytochrome oxidase Cu insertion factor (SCO1/SenC/PrrC family)
MRRISVCSAIVALLLTIAPRLHAEFSKLAAHDVVLLDQNSRQVHFYADLVKGKVVAINSIFTSCTTICTPMGANFAALSRRLGAHAGKDVSLISISIDPLNDTPDRLKTWQSKFNAAPGWELLTGSKRDVDALLRDLGIYTADIQSHSSLLLVGDDRTGEWTRLSALAAPDKTASVIDGILARREEPRESQAQHYFTDVPLIDQDGATMRLYSDLLKGKTVVINSFFTSCEGSCPVMAAAFVEIQKALGDRLGKDVNLISVSVDPETDTPRRLKEYAQRFGARPGWYFLTGEKSDVEAALRKLGFYVENRGDHLNLFIIGNESTGLWKKAFGLANPSELVAVVNSVVSDRQ